MIFYQLHIAKPTSQILEVIISFETALKTTDCIFIPYYRPGRYQHASYEKNINCLTATDAKGENISLIRCDLNKWQPESDGITRINYQYECSRMDAGGSWIDDELLYFNFVNSLLMVDGRENEKIKVEISSDKSFETIYPSRSNRLQYDNYFQLIDEPFIAWSNPSILSFELDEIPFRIITIGSLPLPEVDLADLFKKFSRAQKNVFGKFPFSYYDYIIFCNERTPYHGVEHTNCTVITLPQGKSPEENLNSLLGISSHELFHAWNVCRIRPKELSTYRLQSTVIFDTGYALEGFTTYYGDLMLARSGVIDLDAYLAELNLRLTQYFQFDGRHYASLQSSSRALWANAYDRSSLEKEVSIYGKGMLASLTIDLFLRKSSDNQFSLDDVMKWLWRDSYLQNKPYSHADILLLMEKAGGKEAAILFQKLVGSTEPIEDILPKLLPFVALQWKPLNNNSKLTHQLGIVAQMDAEKLTIVKIFTESHAHQQLMKGDVLVTINNMAPMEYNGEQEVVVEVLRGKRNLKLAWTEKLGSFGSYYEIQKMDQVSEKHATNMEMWIGG